MKLSKVFDSTFLPAKFNGPKRSTKIMIVMHGLGDQMSSFKDFALEVNVTCLDYLLINAPTPYYFGFSWYDIPPGEPRDGIKSSIEKLELLINELNENGYQDEDIILCGFSQGGCISLHSFLAWKRTFAGVVCLSPRIYLDKMEVQAQEVHSKTPIFMAHGHYDQAIDFNSVESQMKRLTDSGLNISFHEYDMGHEIDIIEIRDLAGWLNNQI
ncbi:alpha/beta hydrolase [Halobacteriovorax sp.]|uniref:alpha/beta hydrolase n=1 Tax=Halobacteriovorax sp. TaxID=2020862 RepID=UPI00356B5D9C